MLTATKALSKVYLVNRVREIYLSRNESPSKSCTSFSVHGTCRKKYTHSLYILYTWSLQENVYPLSVSPATHVQNLNYLPPLRENKHQNKLNSGGIWKHSYKINGSLRLHFWIIIKVFFGILDYVSKSISKED